MFDLMRRYKGRLAVFALSFAVGVALAVVLKFVLVRFVERERVTAKAAESARGACAQGDTFSSPEEIAGALRSEDVGVRSEMMRRLSVLPNLLTAYYDFERDADFPARAESVNVRRVILDEEPDEESVVTFVRGESPVAVVLKRRECGWKVVAVVSSWLRFEDYPYADWLELPEAFGAGRHLLLVRDSTGDAARYTRRARLLCVAGDHVEQVAEIDEESIAPVEGYKGNDWEDVKRRRTATFSLTAAQSTASTPAQVASSVPSQPAPVAQSSVDSIARLRVVYREEVVKYSGVEPLNVFWSEADGVWHQARRHWRSRHFEVLKPAVVSEEQFAWDEQKKRFVAAAR